MTQSGGVRARLARYMRANKLKNTRQREAIVDVFLEAKGHLSLEEIQARVLEELPGVGYATVYRTMKLLTEADVAVERRFGDGQVRYELAHGDDEHHDHLICVDCGLIVEFEDEMIERRQEAVAIANGMQIRAHRLVIWGKCEAGAVCDRRSAEG